MRGFGPNMGMLEGPGGDPSNRGGNRANPAGDGQVAERRPNNSRSFFPDMGSLARQMDEMAQSGDGYSFSS